MRAIRAVFRGATTAVTRQMALRPNTVSATSFVNRAAPAGSWAVAGSWHALSSSAGPQGENWLSIRLAKKVAKLGMVDKIRKAAEDGDCEAMTLMGAAHAMGREVPKDDVEAGKWFLAAAEAGDKTAALAAGIWLLEGRGGLETDVSAAAAHLKAAADHGISKAQTMLGILMLEGTGVEKSAAGAAKLFEKASVDNDMVAVYNLGVLLQTGRGVKLSPNKGAELIRKAATAGTAEAQFAVSQWFSSRTLLAPVKYAVEKSPRKRFEWCMKAARQGHPAAQHNVAVALMDGVGADRNPEEAVGWLPPRRPAVAPIAVCTYAKVTGSVLWRRYRKSAAAGNLEAQCNLGMCHIQGTGVPEDKPCGVDMIRGAAEAGYDLAQFNLAVCLATGVAGAPDEGQAVSWLRKAADQGLVPASSPPGCPPAFAGTLLVIDGCNAISEQAMEQLALALRDGRGCEEDALEAEEWESKISRLK